MLDIPAEQFGVPGSDPSDISLLHWVRPRYRDTNENVSEALRERTERKRFRDMTGSGVH